MNSKEQQRQATRDRLFDLAANLRGRDKRVAADQVDKATYELLSAGTSMTEKQINALRMIVDEGLNNL